MWRASCAGGLTEGTENTGLGGGRTGLASPTCIGLSGLTGCTGITGRTGKAPVPRNGNGGLRRCEVGRCEVWRCEGVGVCLTDEVCDEPVGLLGRSCRWGCGMWMVAASDQLDTAELT